MTTSPTTPLQNHGIVGIILPPEENKAMVKKSKFACWPTERNVSSMQI
jgi:hypothetical protein